MDFLRKLPVCYSGELHRIRLINFSVDTDEIAALLPKQLKVREFGNRRAMISMVNVQLKKMHPDFIPRSLSFGYQHIAFRLLIEDIQFNKEINKGIFFLRSFCNKSLIAWGGSLLTDYRLGKADIHETDTSFLLSQGKQYLQYTLEDREPEIKKDWLLESVGALDRAYSVLDQQIRVTQILREKWPLEWITCTDFKTNFFETAQFEGAFRVKEMIPYKWLPAKNL